MKILKKNSTHFIVSTFAVIFLVALDQITKYLAVIKLKNNPPVSIIQNIFQLQYLENRGAAFGIMQGQKNFFILVTAITVLILIYLYIHIPKNTHYFAMGFVFLLLISGAIGNFIDRCMHDYVIDFFYFVLIDFPIFNVADIYVTTAAGLLIFLFLFYYKEEDIDMLLQQLIFWKKKEK